MGKSVFDFIEKEKKENIRFIKAKNKSYVMINNPTFVNGYKDLKRIHMYDSKGLVAELQYAFLSSEKNKYVHLFNVEVFNVKHLGKGLGSYLLKFLEEVSLNKGYKKIEGEFYPKPPAEDIQVERFYDRNKYEFKEPGEGEKNPIIFKNLTQENLNEIENNTHNYAFGYKMYDKLEKFNTEENINSL